VNVSHILATLPVGLEPLAGGTWNLFFGPVHLGWLDEQVQAMNDHAPRGIHRPHADDTQLGAIRRDLDRVGRHPGERNADQDRALAFDDIDRRLPAGSAACRRQREEVPVHPVGFAQKLDRFGEQSGTEFA
jgi:hypothetical protein